MFTRILFLCIFIGTAFITSAPASADRVITTGEVANRVKVRHRPDLDSPAIGSLQYNESAELLESLPYWYHIQLNNGVPGYISRAWTRKLSEAEGDGEVIRAGYWKLGGVNQGSLNFQTIVKVIQANFDVLAVSGLAQNSQPGYDALLNALGSEWNALLADSTSLELQSSAILYRTAIVRPCSGWQKLFSPARIDTRPTFVFGCFSAPVNKSSIGIDFMLGVLTPQGPSEAGEDTQEQVGVLSDVVAELKAAYPSERDIIIAGTFNLSGPDLQDAVETKVLTKGPASVLSPTGELTENLYDHILIYSEDDTVERIDAPHIVDVRAAAASSQDYLQSCSSHLPVLLLLRTTGPDDD